MLHINLRDSNGRYIGLYARRTCFSGMQGQARDIVGLAEASQQDALPSERDNSQGSGFGTCSHSETACMGESSESWDHLSSLESVVESINMANSLTFDHANPNFRF